MKGKWHVATASVMRFFLIVSICEFKKHKLSDVICNV